MPLTCQKLLRRGILLAFLSILLFQSHAGFWQQRRVFRGVVTHEKNTLFAGVSETVKGSNRGVFSQSDECSSIEANEGFTLIVSTGGVLSGELTLRGAGNLGG